MILLQINLTKLKTEHLKSVQKRKIYIHAKFYYITQVRPFSS